ncbi:hypothetical protein ACP4OV_010747 [Aristida adscensionis]
MAPFPCLLAVVLALLRTGAALDGGAGAGGQTRYARVFSFGDSLTDTGNALRVTTGGPPSRPPYGEPFFRRPTGRPSDGRLAVDFIGEQTRAPATDQTMKPVRFSQCVSSSSRAVEALGLPHPTPYLAGETPADFRRGVNFAVGRASALGLDFFESRGLKTFVPVSLRNQTSWFKNVLQSLGPASTGQSKTTAASLFIVGEIGINDYFIALVGNLTVGEAKTFVPHIIGAIRSVLTEVIAAGATTVVVPGMIPLGCEPQLLALYQGAVAAGGYDPASGCITRLNDLAELHNRALRRMLGGLRRRHPGAAIVYADLYRAVTDIIVSPRKYGFRDRPLAACCGGGGGAYNFDMTAFCGAAGAMACADPSEHVSWDGVHFTEAANRRIACAALEGSHAGGVDDDGAPPTPSSLPWSTEAGRRRIGCV